MIQLTKTRLISLLFLASLLFISCSKDSNSQNKNLPNADQYITWNINGDKGSLTSPSDSLASARYTNTTHLVGSSPSTQDGFTITFHSGETTGEYTANFLGLYVKQKLYERGMNTLKVTITKYGKVDDYIEGYYSGKITEPASVNQLPISGDFRLKRR